MPQHRSQRPSLAFASQLRIEALRDEVVEALGYSPSSAYSRRFWLPILGPGSTLAAEKLVAELAEHRDGFDIDLINLGRSLGLPGQGGRWSSIARTLQRLDTFGLARYHEPQHLYRVRLAWPPLTRRQLALLAREGADTQPLAV
jgi:hypothetical protein